MMMMMELVEGNNNRPTRTLTTTTTPIESSQAWSQQQQRQQQQQPQQQQHQPNEWSPLLAAVIGGGGGGDGGNNQCLYTTTTTTTTMPSHSPLSIASCAPFRSYDNGDDNDDDESNDDTAHSGKRPRQQRRCVTFRRGWIRAILFGTAVVAMFLPLLLPLVVRVFLVFVPRGNDDDYLDPYVLVSPDHESMTTTTTATAAFMGHYFQRWWDAHFRPNTLHHLQQQQQQQYYMNEDQVIDNNNHINNHNNNMNVTRVAFVGNSMFYFNDFPRFFENLVAVSSTTAATPSQHHHDQQQQPQQPLRKLVQNSCLHGGASIPSLFYHGNGMYEQFRTESSILTRIRGHTIYDYGACTVPQLLSGNPRFAMPRSDNTAAVHLNPCHKDMIYLQYAKQWFATQILVSTQLQQQQQQKQQQLQLQQQQKQQQQLELESQSSSSSQYNRHHPPAASGRRHRRRSMHHDRTTSPNHKAKRTTTTTTTANMASTNHHHHHHHNLAAPQLSLSSSPILSTVPTPTVSYWNFVVMNDQTCDPARPETRAASLHVLQSFYVPWFQASGAIPVFLWTHAHLARNGHDMPSGYGFRSIPHFTALVHDGYQAYADVFRQALPAAQAPRIAPVGLAFLLVYEENRALWKELFHSDHIHASPAGTFLQGCILHHTLFGTLPDKHQLFSASSSSSSSSAAMNHQDGPARSSSTRNRPSTRNNNNHNHNNNNATDRTDSTMAWLWHNARMMQHEWEPPNPYPNRTTAEYLYRVAERIMVEGYIPQTFHYSKAAISHEFHMDE